MKDFLGVFVLIVLVMGTLGLFAYLAFALNYYWWAILQVVVSTGIILFCIRYFRSHRPTE